MTAGTIRGAVREKQSGNPVVARLASPWGWAVLAVVVIGVLAFGSFHPASPSKTQRIAYLEGVIKCPSCEDVSIAQSDAGVAQALRAEVVRLVDAGWSNPRIETRVEAQYGSDELLVPSSGLIWVIPVTVLGCAVVAIGWFFVRTRRTRRSGSHEEDEELVRGALSEFSEGH